MKLHHGLCAISSSKMNQILKVFKGFKMQFIVSLIFRSNKVRNNSIFMQNYHIMFFTLAQTYYNQINYG